MYTNPLKPRIFIGSSTEGLDVAEYVKAYLSEIATCYVWTDNIFKLNKSFFETLIKEPCFFDFGILIATKDDYLRSRKKLFKSVRDNVIFEFGLFLGGQGSKRAIMICEKGTKLPSDLLGISIPSFIRSKEISESSSLIKILYEIKEEIIDKYSLGELGPLASTALAIGYFTNFVQKICFELKNMPKLEFADKVYDDFNLNIVIPNNLEADLSRRAQGYISKSKLDEIKIKTSTRNYPLYINYEKEEKGILNLYDMPTTIGSIHKAI